MVDAVVVELARRDVETDTDVTVVADVLVLAVPDDALVAVAEELQRLQANVAQMTPQEAPHELSALLDAERGHTVEWETENPLT